MKKKLAVIGAGEFQLPLVLKAREMGYEVHAFAWEEGAAAKDYADYFYPVSITELDVILEKCREIKPSGVCTIGSDLASPTVCYVSENLGLNSNSFSVSKRCTNKYDMRCLLKENGIPVPFFAMVSEGFAIDYDKIPLPAIVKPSDRSGSRAITKITQVSQFEKAVAQAIGCSFARQAVIEGFIEGEEYSCECISYHGEHHFLAFTRKFTTGAPNYIETGHVQPSDIPERFLGKIKDMVFSALTALGITDGASHTEFKIDGDGNVGIIEIGARMGGDCIGSDLVPLASGYDFVKMVIDVACNKAPDLTQGEHYKKAQIRFLFDTDDISDMEKFCRDNPESVRRVSQIDLSHLGNITDSGTRLGYYIFTE